MSQETAMVNYDEMLAQMAKAATAVERPSASNLGVKAGIMTYNGEPIKGNKIDVIVIDSIHANLYYDEKYDSDNPVSPVCFAYSESGEGMVPHPASSKPQHTDCATCPMNQWNSDPDGGRGKACKNSRFIAVVPADSTAEELPNAEIAVMKLPVTSVKGWGMYVNKVAALYNRPPLGVVTTIKPEPDMKTQFKVTFTDAATVDLGKIMPLMNLRSRTKPLLERVYEPNPEPSERKPVKTAKQAKM